MDILNEVYIGRKAILPAEKQLHKLRQKLYKSEISTAINVDPEIIKFNRIMEKIFGFNSYAFYVQPDYVPNAYAFPVGFFFSPEERVKIYNSITSSPDGFNYNKAMFKVSMIMAVNRGLLFNEAYTDSEIMGVILHEVGHAFFEAVTNKDNKYNTARYLIDIFMDVQSKISKRIRSGKKITEDIIDKDISFISYVPDSIVDKIKNVKSSVFVRESMDDNMNRKMVHYTNEKFADTFASMYGYGPDVHSCLVKMREETFKQANIKVKRQPKIIETIQSYELLTTDFLAYLLGIQDEHPNTLARMNITVQYLRKELTKDTIDPKMKRELLSDLQKVEKLIEEYKNYPQDEDRMRVIRLYYIKLYEKFGGDRREQNADNDALFGTIDDRYEEVKEGWYF